MTYSQCIHMCSMLWPLLLQEANDHSASGVCFDVIRNVWYFKEKLGLVILQENPD